VAPKLVLQFYREFADEKPCHSDDSQSEKEESASRVLHNWARGWRAFSREYIAETA